MGAPERTIAGRLAFDVAEETYRVEPDDTLTFGRAARAVVDAANPYMHRVVGRLYANGWSWWIHNEARHMPMTIVGDDDRLKTLPPDAAEPLTTGRGVIRFHAGPTGYELVWELERPPVPPPPPPHPLDLCARNHETDLDAATADFGRVVLSVDQRSMMVAMAERRLRSPGDPPSIPPNAEIAARFGWTLRQFDRKLDYLCRKLTNDGVPGLRGSPGTEAADRRERLVNHMLHNGLITVDDLSILGADACTDTTCRGAHP